MSEETIGEVVSHDGAEIRFSVGFFEATEVKERGRLDDGREESRIILPARIRDLANSVSSSTGKPIQSIHQDLTSFYDSVLSTSTTQELDLLDVLAVVQHWRVNLLPIQWNKGDEELGKGGTAGVAPGVNARVSDDANVKLEFAFKRVHQESLAGSDESADFLALFSEILVLGHPVIQHHPNIIKLEGICWEDFGEKAWPVLVFRRAKHRDMRLFMSMCLESERKLAPGERLKLCGDIANAILLMHACNVIHADLKPENVLIFEDEKGRLTAKVSDFGYSRLRTHNEDQIELPESWPWTAPEIEIENKTTFAGAASADIFSFGMLCIWILFDEALSTRRKAVETSLESILSDLKEGAQLPGFANSATKEMAGISEDRRTALLQFFKLSLSEDVNKRKLDAELVESAFGCTEETEALMAQFGKSANSTQLPFFQLTSAYRQFKTARRSVQESVFKCFETRAGLDINDAARNNSAFQLAFCYNIGFGVPSDPGESTYWLSKCDKGAQGLDDVLEMINDDESRLYGNLKVHASMFTDLRTKSRDKEKDKLVAGELHALEESHSLQKGTDMSAMGPAVSWVFSNLGVKNTEIKFLDVSNSGAGDNGRSELMKRCREEFGWDKDDSEYSTATIEWVLDESDIATKLQSDGEVLDATPQSREAEEKAQLKRVEMKTKVLGQEHPDTLESMETLGRLYWRNEDRWAEAERLVIQVMEILIESLGVDHPDTLEAMQRAAMMHRSFERWEEAEDLLRQIIEARMRLFAIRNTDTLEWLEHLVRLFLDTKNIAEAEKLQTQVVDARMIAPGITNSKGIESMELMVEVLKADEAKFKEAEHMQEHIVFARRQASGDENIQTLKSIEALVAMYVVHGQRYAEAKQLQTQVTDALKRVLGAEHPDTLHSMERLASIHALHQNYQEAEKLYCQIIEIRSRVYGPTHEDGLQAMEFLALVYGMQQRYPELEDVQRRIVETKVQNLGSEDVATLQAKDNLASSYMRLQKWEDAQTLYNDVVESRKRILGTNDPEILKSMTDLATAYQTSGLYEKAEDLLLYILDKRRETLGSQHPMTTRTRYSLAETYKYMGSWKKAEELLHGEMSTTGDTGFTDAAGDTGDEYFKTCRTLEDLDEVIPVLERGVVDIPDDHPIRAMKLHELSGLFMLRFRRFTQQSEDLNTAIKWAEQAVHAISKQSPARPLLLKMLGKALWRRFEETGYESDMNGAVERAQEAADTIGEADPNGAIILANLAKILVRRFEQTQDEDDLNASLMWAEQANMSLDPLPDDHPDRAKTLRRLSDAHWHRFNYSENMDSLKDAIRYGEQALKATVDDDCKLSLRLRFLGEMSKAQFELTKSLEDLEKAVIWSERTVESVPNTGKVAFSRCVWLGDLIHLLEELFKLTENLDHLDQSIRRAEEAASIASDEALELPLGAILSNLAIQYFDRFTHSSEAEYLEKALQTADRSVEVTPEGHKNREHVLQTQQAIYEQIAELMEMVAAEGEAEQNDEFEEQVDGTI